MQKNIMKLKKISTLKDIWNGKELSILGQNMKKV